MKKLILFIVTCFAVVFSSFVIADNEKEIYLILRLEGNNTLVLTDETMDCIYGRYAFLMNQFGKNNLSACWESINSNAAIRVTYADGDIMQYSSMHFTVIEPKKTLGL